MRVFPQAPLNNLLVQIDEKFTETVTYPSGVKLFRYTGFHPEEYVTTRARVRSVPRGIQQRQDYEGLKMPISPGDEILPRYDVIFRYVNQPDRDTPIYKNLLFHEGQEYWKVDIQQVLGVYRDGEIVGVNNYVICEAMEEPTSFGRLIVPAHLRRTQVLSSFRVKYRQPRHDLEAGTVIEVRPGIAQRYEIDHEVIYVINYERVLALQ